MTDTIITDIADDIAIAPVADDLIEDDAHDDRLEHDLPDWDNEDFDLIDDDDPSDLDAILAAACSRLGIRVDEVPY